MERPSDFASLVTSVLHAKRVEPEKRNKDGVRWIVHRFPIRGGISLHEALNRDTFGVMGGLMERLLRGQR